MIQYSLVSQLLIYAIKAYDAGEKRGNCILKAVIGKKERR
jgi:hypothetical protein